MKDFLLSKIEPVTESGCWIWRGALTSDGYARIWINGVRKMAHIVFYEAFKEPMPRGLVIDHLCCVRACLNPDHLEAVTSQINNLRSQSVSGVNARKSHCVRGHLLTEESCYERYKDRRVCVLCARERASRFFQANREDQLLKRKAYYASHKDKWRRQPINRKFPKVVMTLTEWSEG